MFDRRHETPYLKCQYIAEFWNTLSNLPFIIFGVLRLIELINRDKVFHSVSYISIPNPNRSYVFDLYVLSILTGLGSGIHHMILRRGSIIIDWIPISMTIIYILFHSFLLSYISCASWFKLFLAIYILFDDHVLQTVPVPWGHVMWHLVASFAIDGAYQDMLIHA